MKNFIFSTMAVFLLVNLTYASDAGDSDLETKIKSSSEYRWGESVASDPASAKEAARADLSQKIWIAVTASSGRRVTEEESGLRDSTVVETHTYSALHLQNLGTLTFPQGDMTRVVAYIDTTSLSKSFEVSKRKVRDMVKLALQAESEGRIGDALKRLYRAYLLTHTFVGELDLGFDGIDIADAQMAVVKKMKQIASNISIRADQCYRAAGSTHAALTLSYGNHPVQNLDFTYYCGEGDDQITVTKGEKAYITIYKELTQRRPSLPLRIEYTYAGEMRHQPEILNLYRIFADRCFDLFIEAELFVPWIPEEAMKGDAPEGARLSKPAPCDWSISIRVLSEIRDKGEFQTHLTTFKDAGHLYTASDETEISAQDRCFLALYCMNEMAALLFYDGTKYKNVRTGRIYSDYRDALPARGEASGTWIGESKH